MTGRLFGGIGGGTDDSTEDGPVDPHAVRPVDGPFEGPFEGPFVRPFVGRDREIGEITRGLDESMAGRGRFFLLMGEPGIGKTRLCDELATLTAARAIPTFWGRAWEAGGAPAYWPWMDVLAGVSRLVDGDTLRSCLGDGAVLLADLVPEMRAQAAGDGALAPLAALAPDEARFRLWRTVTALVRRAAEPRGLTLMFDDLHSTDHSSLLLLYALARELRSMRVLVVATCRDVEAHLDKEASALITRLGREAVTLGIARLDRATVTDLLRRRTGFVPPEIEARLCDSTQGNPLFLEEMLRLRAEEGDAAIAARVVPSGVRDVIRQRLERVGVEARHLLELAAVVGDEVSRPVLAAAAQHDHAWVSAQVAAAVHAGVFMERAGRARFSHALVREVLYGDLSDERRQELHHRIGAALEMLAVTAARPLPLMELAHHAVEGPPTALPRAVDFSVRAASRSVELTAVAEAVAVLGRVADAVEAAGNPPALRARVTLALGETRIRRGDVQQGKTLCCEAATLAKALGDSALLADAALTYGRVFTFAVVDPVLVQLLEDALEAQPAGDSARRARLLARLAGALQPAMNASEPVRIAREAIATARRLGDRRALLETLHDGLSALMDVIDPRERRDLNLEVERLAVAEGDPERLLRTHARLALDHLALGAFAEADARIDAFAALAEQLRASWIAWRVPLFRAVRAITHGRFEEAQRWEDEARTLAAKIQDPQAERALILNHEGLVRAAERHEEMRALHARSRQARTTFHNSDAWQGLASALLFTRLEDEEAARFHLEALPAELRPPTDNLFALVFIAEPAAYVGSRELAQELYQLLSPHADQCVMLGMTQIQWEGPITRLLGLLAARLGRWEVASAHFEDAIARLRRLEAPPHLARTQYEFARALQQHGHGEDPARARALFAAARELAVAFDMSGLKVLIDRRMTARTETKVSAADNPALSLCREGEYWAVTTPAGDTVRLKDGLGLQYLARLLSQPDCEIHVLDLVSQGLGGGEEAAGVDGGDAGELLDEEARALYRRRLEDLRDALSEAEAFGDTARATKARSEIDFLATELGRAVGLGGRTRRAGAAAERARIAVQRRIKNAIDRITQAAPEAGAILARCIRTGNFCVYRPADAPAAAPSQRRS